MPAINESIRTSRWQGIPAALTNKSLLTNLVALGFIAIGHLLPGRNELVLNIGYYAFSGAITNWIAIYMLFEKVPGFYGSGVVPLHFEEFKKGIENLVMGQFFTRGNVERFFAHDTGTLPRLKWEQFSSLIDEDLLFNKLVAAIVNSPIGGMLAFIGGAKGLEPLKAPMISGLKETLKEIVTDEKVALALKESVADQFNSDHMIDKVNHIVHSRLDELTPRMVKEIVQEMIEKHLGWLVVWGGVLGALIGAVAYLAQKLG